MCHVRATCGVGSADASAVPITPRPRTPHVARRTSVACADLAKERLQEDLVMRSHFVAFFLPMHTATRLALPVIARVAALNPGAVLCAYGLYAPLNAPLLRSRGVSIAIGGEFEDELVAAALTHGAPPAERGQRDSRNVVSESVPPGRAPLARVAFHVPFRDALPPLSRYATLQAGDQRLVAGYTEASRGCKHRCRHCPIVPLYDGRFRIVPVDVVMADARAQVAAGARHVTFGDPDFFNGIRHAVQVVERFARECPGVSYDVTIKVEHLLRHADVLPVLRDTGCAFVTSAVESVDDDVLAKLEKGHTRADFERAVESCRAVGLTLTPTFVAFTPWTTVPGYCDMLQEIDRLDLVDHVAPIQLTIRLLIPEGSRLLELDDVRAVTREFDPSSLIYPWVHADPHVDTLNQQLAALVGVKLTASRRDVFESVWRHTHEAAQMSPPPHQSGAVPRAAIPYLNEPWYC
ncbi:MAG: CUAEP/CCAEP-tail radical SAM protein [Acidobacteria bacterium]|nr:CUAEP/CCAEP-tail radical SAM protein [Acidobacteriota bacterium]